MSPRLGRATVPLLLAVVSLLPHLGALVSGRAYFFRDFGMAFYPYREFWAREAAAGRWPFWNPFVQEGVVAFPAFYPPDLLHAFWRGPAFVSFLLTLHFPLAAWAAYTLARDLGAGRRGAFLCGAIYSLGGLAIASLNLYVFLQALALAPFVTCLLLRASVRGGRWIPAAGLMLAISLTTAQEFVGQAVLLGLALGLTWSRPRGRGAAALGIAVGLGIALASVPLSLVAGILPETVRGRGLPALMTLDYSLHPAVLLQVLIRDFFGSVTQPLDLWWGHRFFTKGYPYFVTLYLGPHVLAIAACGVRTLAPRRRWLLLALAGAALWYALGPYGGLAPTISTWPVVRSFRFPSKALLLPYLVIAVLAARGADRLGRGAGWTTYLRLSTALGTFALGLALLASAQPVLLGEWMVSDPRKDALLGSFLEGECLWAAVLALLGAGVALYVRNGRLPAARGLHLIGILLVADLVRAASGVNPQTSPRFYELLPETAEAGLDRLDGGRVFTYGTEASPGFRAFLEEHAPGTLVLASFVKRQTLAPYVQQLDRVETTPADDIGAFVFIRPEIAPAEYDPRLVGSLLSRLRGASVSRILSLDPLDHPELRLLSTIPSGAPDLDLRIYELRDPWPRAYVACRVHVVGDQGTALSRALSEEFDPAADVALERAAGAGCTSGTARRLTTWPGHDEYEVALDGPGYLVTRDSFARGWTAHVEGAAAEVVRANGKHRAVLLPAGRHHVVFEYVPPGLRKGLWGFAAGLLAALALCLRPVLRAPPRGSSDPTDAPAA